MSRAKKFNFKKWLLIILGVLIAVILIGIIFLDEIAEERVRSTLDEVISNDPDPLYDYSYDRLDLSLTKGDLTIYGIKVTPRQAAMDSLEAGAIKVLLEASISEFKIRGLELLELLEQKTLDIGKIEVDRPQVKYHVNSQVEKVGNSLVLNDLLSDDLRSVTADQILISNASVEYFDVKERTPKISLDSVYLEFDSIYADSVTLSQPMAFTFSEARFEAHQYDQELSELYHAKAEKIYIDYQQNVLIIDKPQLIPTKQRHNYGEITKTETDLFTISGESIELEGFVTGSFAEKGLLTIPKVRLNGIDLEIYRDKHLQDPPFKKIPLPVTALKSIPIPIKVDSIFLSDCKISSSQLDTLNDKAGTLFFTQMSSTITNFTNDSAAIAENNLLETNSTALFMGIGALSAQMTYDLDSPIDQFHVKARLGQMDAKHISPVLDSLLLVRISSGRIHSLTMDFYANDDRAEGTMDFRYEDIKLDIQKLNKGGQSNKMMNLLANSVVKTSNIQSQKNYKQGIISVERRKDRAVFNFIWNATKSGLISTATPIKGSNKPNTKKKK